MTDTPQPAAPASPPPKSFWRKHFWAPSFSRHSEHRHPFVYYARRYDAQFYALIVAIGVPLMGWSIGDVTIQLKQPFVISAYMIKSTIAMIWFAIAHEYWALELDEIRAQIAENNLLEVEQSDYQRSTMQSLYWGAAFAFAVWLVGWIIAATTYFFSPKMLWFGPSYGLVEFFVLGHTLWVGRRVIKRVYPIITIIQQALAGQLRRETPARAD